MPQKLRTELGDIGAKFIIDVTGLLQLSICSPLCIRPALWNELEPMGARYVCALFGRRHRELLTSPLTLSSR